jgi:HlyD family secretion protein
MKKLLPVLLVLVMAACNEDENLFSGSIEIDEIRISARVGGQITEIKVEEGDEVIPGQLLVTIDDSQYHLLVARSEAALSAAEAGLGTLLEGTRTQQIVSASASVSAARAERIQREADFLRAQQLFAAGALSEQNLQSAETAAVTAAERYNAAVQSYSLAAEGARSTEILAGEAAVASAEASLQIALSQLEWTALSSPAEGTVTSIDVRAGENISAGMTLLVVAPMDTVEVVFYLPESFLARVSPGAAIQVSPSNGEPVPGTLTRISDQAEFTPSNVETRDGRTSLVYRAEGTIPNPGGLFKAGMPVDVRIPESL